MIKNHMYLIYKSKQTLSLNNLQSLIWHKTKTNLRRTVFDTWTAYLCYTKLFEIELFLHFAECKQKLYYNVWNRTVYMYEIDLALNNLKWLCHKNQIKYLKRFIPSREI